MIKIIRHRPLPVVASRLKTDKKYAQRSW